MCHMENKQERNLSRREESGFFFSRNLKIPPRRRFYQMNRYPFSKASCLAVGERDGEREGSAGGCGGWISRQRADTIKTEENELLNTPIKKYKTWPSFYTGWAALQAGDKGLEGGGVCFRGKSVEFIDDRHTHAHTHPSHLPKGLDSAFPLIN